MSLEILLMAAIGLLIGIGIGFFAGRSSMAKETKQKAEIESELWQTKREVEDYRHQVNHHFEKTAELMGNLTDSYKEMTLRYKAVYEHLAHGAQTLASREVSKKLSASTIDQLIYEANEDIHVAEKNAKLLASSKGLGGESKAGDAQTASHRTSKSASRAEKKTTDKEQKKAEKANKSQRKQEDKKATEIAPDTQARQMPEPEPQTKKKTSEDTEVQKSGEA